MKSALVTFVHRRRVQRRRRQRSTDSALHIQRRAAAVAAFVFPLAPSLARQLDRPLARSSAAAAASADPSPLGRPFSARSESRQTSGEQEVLRREGREKAEKGLGARCAIVLPDEGEGRKVGGE